MAKGKGDPLTQVDLDRAVRAVASLLETDEVVVVGNQALLLERGDIDRDLRASIEFDMYSANAARWERIHSGLGASEQIAAMLGEGSHFHEQHGYFVDGVDERTAILPSDWRNRQVVRTVQTLEGSSVRAIAPCATDIVAAKLHRGDPKDIVFASRCLRLGLTKHDEVLRSIRKIEAPDGLMAVVEKRLKQASLKKNSHVAARGPVQADSLDIMFHQLQKSLDRAR